MSDPAPAIDKLRQQFAHLRACAAHVCRVDTPGRRPRTTVGEWAT